MDRLNGIYLLLILAIRTSKRKLGYIAPDRFGGRVVTLERVRVRIRTCAGPVLAVLLPVVTRNEVVVGSGLRHVRCSEYGCRKDRPSSIGGALVVRRGMTEESRAETLPSRSRR